MDLENIKNKLLIKYPFFGNIIANCTFYNTSSTKISDTDGRNIYYNEKYINSLNDEEQLYVFAHEIFHVAFDHVKRSKNKNKEVWGIASDAIINGFLKKDGLPLLKNSIEIENSTNYSVDELYNILYLQIKNNDSSSKNNENIYKILFASSKDGSSYFEDGIIEGESNTLSTILNSNHKLWDKGKNCKSNQKQEEKINELKKMGEKEAFKQNKIERDNKLNDLILSLLEQSKGVGNTTNSETRNTDNIGKAKQLIDWRVLLKEAIKYDIDFSYENATIENGVITPHLEELPHPETEIVLDTSGSISDTLLKNFLKECKHILQRSKVYVGCFDTKFYGFKELRNEKDIDKMKFVGGGGTDFNVAVNAFTKRVENKIIFTDGHADIPNKKLDVIWIVFGDKKIKPPEGKVIYIDDKELKKVK